jgi:glycosyltransferase involved in cell wall biosynthesis
MISCLMITQANRHALAERAIAAFDAQSYKDRELIIVTLDDVSALKRPFYKAKVGTTLNQMRGIGLGVAKGDLVCLWDDDDVHHPDRLKRQVEVLATVPQADACLLERVLLHWPERGLAVVSEPRQWEPTLLAKRLSLLAKPGRFPPTPRNEVDLGGMSVVQLCEPWLYTYFVHGANTNDASHFQHWFDRAVSR